MIMLFITNLSVLLKTFKQLKIFDLGLLHNVYLFKNIINNFYNLYRIFTLFNINNKNNFNYI